jgi:hypothetical protein
MAGPDPDALLRQRPFAGVARLVGLRPLADDVAHSGGAFLAEADDGRRFKLRACESETRAREIASHMRALPAFFPELLAQEGPLLLIEYLDGEPVMDRKQLRPFAHQLGRAYADIHGAGELRGLRGVWRALRESLRIRVQFRRHIRALRRIDRELSDHAECMWKAWHREFGLPVALELRDAHKANFMIDRAGALRYVDEDGRMYAMRGIGLGKLLADPGARPGSPKRTFEWYAFCEGYSEAGDAGYLSPEYCAYARLMELVRSIEFKHRTEGRVHKVDEELDELRELVGPEVKRPPRAADVEVAPKSAHPEGRAGEERAEGGGLDEPS